MSDTPTSVYSYFDKNGRLLYVGVTSRGFERAHEHSATKSWWWLSAGCSLEHYPTRSAALDRERELIERHNPPFNKQHNRHPRPYASRPSPESVPTAGMAPAIADGLLRVDGWYQMNLRPASVGWRGTPILFRLHDRDGDPQVQAPRGAFTTQPGMTTGRPTHHAGSTAGLVPRDYRIHVKS